MAHVLRRLGLNAVFLQPRMGGVETYVRRLVPELLAAGPGLEIRVFVNSSGRDLLAREDWDSRVRLVTHPALGIRITRALGEAALLGRLARHEGLDLLHSVAFTGPLSVSSAHVLTIPDVIWAQVPGAVDRVTERVWRTLVPRVARGADRILTYSESSRLDISTQLGIDPRRIDAVPLGPGLARVEPTPETELRNRLGLGTARIVLAVSALRPHKNLRMLVEAMVKVRASHPEVLLVIPGTLTPHGQDLLTAAAQLGIGDAVVLPGWTDDADLEGLYAAAACFAFPSRHEGFGLPVLEAMRRGVPVACASASSLPEVAGDAALYFHPHRPDEIADAVKRILADPDLASELVLAGQERSALFTWRRTAEETIETYERAMSDAARRTGRR